MELSRAKTKRQERTNAIVEAAKRLFDERGYDVVTMRDIADAVGISPGLIYRYRASKADILADILVGYIQEQAAHLKACPKPEGAAVDRLMHYLCAMFAFDLERIELRRLASVQSWNWERGLEYRFVVEVLDLFEPIMSSLEEIGVELDLTARWAIWAIYTEALRRAGYDLDTVENFEAEVAPQIGLVMRGLPSD